MCEVESHMKWSHSFKIDHSHNSLMSLNTMSKLVKEIISHDLGILREREKSNVLNKLGFDSFPSIEINSMKEM